MSLIVLALALAIGQPLDAVVVVNAPTRVHVPGVVVKAAVLPQGVTASLQEQSVLPPLVATPLPGAVVPVQEQVSAAPSPLAALIQAKPNPEENGARAPPERQEAKSRTVFDGAAKPRSLSILEVGAEVVPYIKTGGLADVVDAVARGMADRGHDVTLVIPNYRNLRKDGLVLKPAGEVSVPVGDRTERAQLLVGQRAGVRVVLLDNAGYYDHDGSPYDSGKNGDEQFGFYSRAALEAVKTLGIRPDIVHAHDWHSALIPAFLKLVYAGDPFFAATRTVLTIHNLAFQGAFGKDTAIKLGFSAKDVDEGPLGHFGGLNSLKAGIVLADAVTTVSPTYAREIRETSEFGMSLEGVLSARSNGVTGILNGVDPALYDPLTDPHIARHYDTDDVAAGKAGNKAELQRRLGLEQRPDAPLFVVAARLSHQKGIDIILDAAQAILRRGGQLAIIGSGDKELEQRAAQMARDYPGRVGVHPFDEFAVQLFYAAGDFLLMPSRFEPCGLSQLIAQRFGTLPLVTPIGGLADTVRDLRQEPKRGDGLFMAAPTAQALAEAIAAAVRAYNDPEALAQARRAAMEKDSSWGSALDIYEALMRQLVTPLQRHD